MMACQTKSLHLAPLLTATNENVVMRQDFAGICLFAIGRPPGQFGFPFEIL
jgi:hypothetical protein